MAYEQGERAEVGTADELCTYGTEPHLRSKNGVRPRQHLVDPCNGLRVIADKNPDVATGPRMGQKEGVYYAIARVDGHDGPEVLGLAHAALDLDPMVFTSRNPIDRAVREANEG